MTKLFTFLFICLFSLQSYGSYILIPMDEATQKEHLKAYGITYQVLAAKQEAFWLLNYNGGSFAFQYNDVFKKECIRRGVSFKIIPTASFNNILEKINGNALPRASVKTQEQTKIWSHAGTLLGFLGGLWFASFPFS